MLILPIMVLYGIMIALIVTPEMKTISCIADADNNALISAANQLGVCDPADPLHCSVARKLCPSIAEFETALTTTYAITPLFYIFLGSVRPTHISLPSRRDLAAPLNRSTAQLGSHRRLTFCSAPQLFAWNRSQLQTKLGMPNDGFMNCIP